MHFWDPSDGTQQGWMKINELTGSHTTISCISFSLKFRLYLIVTADFRMFFLNELLNLVQTIDMSQIRLVNYACFNDKDD